MMPPDDTIRVGSLVDRSGLMIVQLCPPLVVLWMYCVP